MSFLLTNFLRDNSRNRSDNLSSLRVNQKLDRVSLKLKIFPITPNYKDRHGNLLRLWGDSESEFYGSVAHLDGRVTIIPSSGLINPLNPKSPKETLINIKKGTNKYWDLVFVEKSNQIVIWPHLIASGQDNPHWKPNTTFTSRPESIAHIFRANTGHSTGNHFLSDTPQNRNLIQQAASDKKNWEGTYRFDIKGGFLTLDVYMVTITEGKFKGCQVWAYVNRETNIITDGGYNYLPHKWDPTGGHKNKGTAVLKYFNLKNCKLKPNNFPGTKQFQETVQKNGLVRSYNSSHQNSPMPNKAGVSGEMGGVGVHTELIQNLFSNAESLFDNEHLFFMPALEQNIPFSDAELSQILRELAIGIYVHDTTPFFSLHFNQHGDLYPVIHPVYEKTLVGQVISMLDYIMKGYLNGGVFNESFVQKWYKNPDWKEEFSSALKEIISFKDYCKEHLKEKDQKYLSLRDLTFNAPLTEQGQPSIFKDYTQFSNSFRIIAKQKSIQKADNLFVLDWDFDVKYTIEPNPEYTESLQQYCNMHGKMPEAYENMVQSYELMGKFIHDHMIKLPLCRKYFSMLGLISFFSSYFMTLKKNYKMPLLPTFYSEKNDGSPLLFPHLPIGQFREELCNLNFIKVVEPLYTHHSVELKKYLLCENPQEEDLTALKKPLEESFLKNLLSACPQSMVRAIKKTGTHSILPSIQKEGSETLEYLREIFNKFGKEDSCKKMAKKDLYDAFIKTLSIHFKDEIINFSLKDHVMSLQPELPARDIESGKKIVGGCGLEMQPQMILSSANGEVVLQEEWLNIQQSPPETWVQVGLENGAKHQGAVFRLMFDDIPAQGINDYQWMESTLLASNKEAEKMLDDMEEIIEAFLSKEMELYQELLNKTSNLVLMRDRHRRTLLHLVVMNDNVFYTRQLIIEGLSPELVDGQGYTPLHYAAMYGNLNQMQMLIDQAPQTIHISSYHGATPLITAIQNHHLQAVRFLLNNGAKGDVRLVSGYSALHCAIHHGREDIVIELLESSEEARQAINLCTEEGVSPLMLACELESEKLVDYLLKHRAEPNLKRKDGLTALDISIKQGTLSLCKLLFRDTDFSNHTIELAVKESSPDIVMLLIKKEGFTKYRNFEKDTSLMIAIRHGSIHSALHILSKIRVAEDLTAQNSVGESAIDLAIKGKFFSLVEEILNKEINQQKIVTINPMELLRRLCRLGYSHFLRDYLNKQTHLTAKDYEELLQIAAESGQHLIITLLLLPKKLDLDKVQGPKGWKIEHFMAKSNGVFLFKKIARKKDLIQPHKVEGKTLAYISAENGSWLVLRFILEQMKAHHISLFDHFNQRHLFYGVIERGEIEGVRLILEVMQDSELVNAVIAEEGIRPIHLAAKIGSRKILELLFSNGARLNEEDHNGYSALYYAIGCQSTEAVEFLLKQRVTVTSDAIYAAATCQNKVLLTLLINQPNSKIYHPRSHFEGFDSAKAPAVERSNEIPYCNIGSHSIDSTPGLWRCQNPQIVPTGGINIPCKRSGDTALIKAIKSFDSKAFFFLLAFEASLECQNLAGWTPLHLASASGQSELLEVIVKRVPFNEGLINGNNALHIACKEKQMACVKVLLKAGYNKIYPNHDRLTAQQLTAGHTGILAEFGVNHNEVKAVLSNFEQALLAKDVKKIESILMTFPVNEKVAIHQNGKTLTGTLLHLALRCCNTIEAVCELAKTFSARNDIHPDLCDGEGNSYAHLLVKAGFNPVSIPHLKLDMKNYLGQSILHLAAEECDDKLLEEIIGEADLSLLNKMDREGQTPLFYAIKAKKQKNVASLLKRGADGHHRDKNLLTPLIFACGLDQLLIVRTLVENGVNVNQPGTIEMVTPLFISLSLIKNDDLSLYFLFNGSSSDAVSEDGTTLSHIAAQTGKISILKHMANQGFSLEASNLSGFQPIHAASMSGQTKVLSLFESMHMFLDAPVLSRKKEKESKEDKDWKEKATPLLLATAEGQVDTVKWLLRHHANPEAMSENKFGVLSCAADSMNKSMLEVFRGYNVSQDEKQIYPAIIRTIRNGDPFYLSALYSNISIQTPLGNGWTGLHFASFVGSLEATQFFLNKGQDPTLNNGSEESVLELAAANKCVEQFRLLLKHSGEKLNLNQFNDRKETLLHIATRSDNISHVMLLIDYGASLDLQDALGRTPLHIAAQEGHEGMTLLLMACGADFSIKTFFNEKTPLEMVNKENLNLQISMKKGEMLRTDAKNGETLLHFAVKAGNNKAVLLLSRQGDVDCRDGSGYSPLHMAVDAQSFPIMRILLKNDANINIQDNAGRTPLWLACIEKKNQAIAKFLIKAGADQNIKNAKGLTIKDQLIIMNQSHNNELLEMKVIN